MERLYRIQVKGTLLMMLTLSLTILVSCATPVEQKKESQGSTEDMMLERFSLLDMSLMIGAATSRPFISQVMYSGRLALPINRDRFVRFDPNPIKLTTEEPVSTFSIDVDTASYAFVRRSLYSGVLPPKDAVRIEEMLNYFDYAYPLPQGRDPPFRLSTWFYPTPWNPDTRILQIGIKGFDIKPEQRPRANLVFLVDTSGSMSPSDRLPLIKQGLRLLVNELEPSDTVAIVVYAGQAGIHLESTSGSNKSRILGAINELQARGFTAGGEGIRQAYALAERNYDPDAVNRVILATDGDFNVGITDPEQLKGFVARKRQSGIYLTILGVGRGNYNDALMQQLAQAGNGNAAYIDTLKEARKVLVEEMASNLFPIANDVKIQVEFNPAHVVEYRLIGYETRMLGRDDFRNDDVDAGDIGSGHTVTALYEIVPLGSPARLTEPLRYGNETFYPESTEHGEVAFVKMRYKLPGEDVSKPLEQVVLSSDLLDVDRLPLEARFAAAVAAFGQRLKDMPYLGDFGFEEILALALDARGEDVFGYRAEFVDLIRAAKSASSMPVLEMNKPLGSATALPSIKHKPDF